MAPPCYLFPRTLLFLILRFDFNWFVARTNLAIPPTVLFVGIGRETLHALVLSRDGIHVQSTTTQSAHLLCRGRTIPGIHIRDFVQVARLGREEILVVVDVEEDEHISKQA